MKRMLRRSLLVALGCLVGLPFVASAQQTSLGTIAGQVRDESGGVLPGVVVEAASPVLIERVRSVSTDDQGRYRMVNLIPSGDYKVTFTLPGFTTASIDHLEVMSNFVATINMDLKVGSLAETVTVTSQSPTVDVSQASRTLVLTRDLIDALPTSRNMQSVGQYMPGLRQTIPDMGGTHYMNQSAMFGHGASRRNTTLYLDGVLMNANKSDGGTQQYYNDQLNAEVAMTTAALPADIGPGGISVQAVPKDGGNLFAASLFLGRTNGDWQSDNKSAEAVRRGLRDTNAIRHISNFTGVGGGPIKRDRLWLLLGAGHIATDEYIAGTPRVITFTDGTKFDETYLDQFVNNVLARVTTQVSQKNKISAFLQRNFKFLGKNFTAGTDPYHSASRRPWNSANYGMGTARWTSTLTNRLLFEASWGYNNTANLITFMPWQDQPKYLADGATINPKWIANVGKTDTQLNKNPDCVLPDGCLRWGTIPGDNRSVAARKVINASTAYVTGSHSLRTGFSWSMGERSESSFVQGDLIANFVAGVPSSVTVSNTPTDVADYLVRDGGAYIQDAWVIKRMTLNPGLRVEYYSSYTEARCQPAGRFRPLLCSPKQTGISWDYDFAPRLSMAYDVFGNGSTAIKLSASKYYAPFTPEWGRQYATGVSQSENRNWFDTDLLAGTSTRSGLVLATNGDGIPQDNEIGPGTAGFGLSPQRTHEDNFEKFHNWEYTAAIQRQLRPGMAAQFGFFHRSYYNLFETDRTLIGPADYTSFTTPMPNVSQDPDVAAIINPAEILTIYNLNTAKRASFGQPLFDYNSKTEKAIYNGIEVGFTARVAKGTFQSSLTADKNVQALCDNNDDNPNGTTVEDLFGTGSNQPSGGRFCDQTKTGKPWRYEVKFIGTYALPFGTEFATSLQSYAGLERQITWSPPASIFPGGRTNAETILLNAPGTLYYPRYNQLDVNIKKTIRRGTRTFTGQLDVFNVLNSGAILTENNSVGASLGQVLTTLQGRLPRIVFQMRW